MQKENYVKLGFLGLQHAFTMFGATILVPILTGLDISVALVMTGVATLLFHLVTKGKVPAYMGSSFAFIAPIALVVKGLGVEYAQSGIFIAGVIHALFALLIYYFGSDNVLKFFPPIVTGPMIIVIGLKLAPVAINMAKTNWVLAIVSFMIVVVVSIFAKGFIRIVPVIIGIFGGYIFALAFNWVDFTALKDVNSVISLPKFSIIKFNLDAILVIAPVSLVTLVEHVGDVIAIGATVKKDFVKEPGIHRTMLGDGVASMASSILGGPVCTTYSENTGVLALTKAHNPIIMRIAALFAIILGFVPFIGGLIRTIPQAVIGGISIVLFGMIASVGIRTIVENNLDFTKSRNLIIASTIMVIGLGGATIGLSETLQIEGLALSAIIGIILNQVLPNEKSSDTI